MLNKLLKDVYARFTSRTTLFAAFFAYTSFWLAKHSLLTNQYVCVITALHVTVVARSVAEDRKEAAGNDGGSDASGS